MTRSLCSCGSDRSYIVQTYLSKRTKHLARTRASCGCRTRVRVSRSTCTRSETLLTRLGTRADQPALFLPYSRIGHSASAPDTVLEVQRISPDADKQRCWFIDQEVASGACQDLGSAVHIVAHPALPPRTDGSIAMFTPFDPAFFAISYLSTLPPHYQTYADLWDAVSQRAFEPLGELPSSADAGATVDDFAEDLSRLGQMQALRDRFRCVCELQRAFCHPPPPGQCDWNEPSGSMLKGSIILAASSDNDEPLLRYSSAKALDLLRAKVDALASPDGGIFGPLESTEPGEDRKPLDDAAVDAGAPAFSSAKRGLGKEDVGSGHGLSAEIQTGEQACSFPILARGQHFRKDSVAVRSADTSLHCHPLESRQKYAIGIIANYLPPAVTKQLLAVYECVSRSSQCAYLCKLTDTLLSTVSACLAVASPP